MRTEKKRKIAVIGGAGFIGTALVRRLIACGEQVVILDKIRSAIFPELSRVVDVRDPHGLVEQLAGMDVIYNLAAEHKDNVQPVSLYYDVNVRGAENVCAAAEACGVSCIIFTSSVAVYGYVNNPTGEDALHAPFSDYGWSKSEAEKIYREWCDRDKNRRLVMVRPTVVFGPGNRGNVYTLLSQIHEGRFLMVGSGRNIKSLAFVENVAAFLEHVLQERSRCAVYNYADKPDMTVGELVASVYSYLGYGPRWLPSIPFWLGYTGGILFDFLSRVIGRDLPISAVRVKKFCAGSHILADRALATGFTPPCSLREGLQLTIQSEFSSPERHIPVIDSNC